jgi:hypothetical protein
MSCTEIEALLARAFPPLTPSRLNGNRGPWSLPPGSGGAPRVGITVDDNWASLQIHAKHFESRLRSIVRADVPLLVNTVAGRAWVVRQLRASYEGMLIAAGQEARPVSSPRDSGTLEDPELLALACRAGGWSAAVKPDGTIRIDLQIRAAQRSVMIQASDAGIRVWVTLAPGAAARASAPCRTAASHFLMRASAALRWARAFASSENGLLNSVGFECFVAAPAYEQALLRAVDTLIAACELFGCEVEALLEHPDIAARYTEFACGFGREAEDGSRSPDAVAPRAASASHAAHAALA